MITTSTTRNVDHLRVAENLARLILQQTTRIRRTPLVGASLLSWIPFFSTSDKKKFSTADIEAVTPEIHEIILFGSLAKGRLDPGDIDLIIFDNGCFSRVFMNRLERAHLLFESSNVELRQNLLYLLEEWFQMKHENYKRILRGIGVDLHIMPITVLQDEGLRRDISFKHSDPRFLHHVFQHAKRYDKSAGRFVRVTLDELEEKYDTFLNDLR